MRRHQGSRAVAVGVGLALIASVLVTAPLAHAAPAVAAEPQSVNLCAEADQASEYQHGYTVAAMTVASTDASCLRTYALDSGLLDGEVDRTVAERADRPVLRTGSAMLDSLYALALHEEKLLSVDYVSTDNYNGGAAINCSADGVGCYITGKNWSYVWTRDLAYAGDLGLALIDPVRMRNSLDFKLSERRDTETAAGTDAQIIQDTGTGGSYPNSTDRTSWAVGATEVLPWLDDAKRADFAERSLEAIANTIEHDRNVVYNPTTGLYRGETSFLDWRQQTYPFWTAEDVTQIATSESLSTNVTHWVAIDAAANLAQAAGDAASATRYRTWANSLRTAIQENFWLADQEQFATVLSNALNLAPAERYDALGTALTVLTDIATEEQAAQAIASYPQTPFGPAVIWPQQQEDERSYHNKGIWPFVTAYMLRAAAHVGNDQATASHFDSMVRQSAMFASNYENMNITTGDVDTVLNSERQTWSVAGTLGMFQDVIFGIEATEAGLAFAPYLPAQVRQQYFPGSDQISLSNVDFRGARVDVVLNLPQDDAADGAYAVTALTVNGQPHALGAPVTPAQIGESAVIEVQLGDAGETVAGPEVVNTYNTGGDDWPVAYDGDEAVFGPWIPEITDVPTPGDDGTSLTLPLDLKEQDVASMTILRDGLVVAEDIDPSSSWTDTTATAQDRLSYCYAVRTTYASGNTSQDSDPTCYWGPDFDRITKIEAKDFDVTGGEPVTDGGVVTHYADWGTGDDDSITVELTPEVSGTYLIQTDYSLGYDIRSGVASAMKRVSVTERDGGAEVGDGILVMPNTDTWENERGSTLVPVNLKAGTTYQVALTNDRYTANMSYFQANAFYNDTTAGAQNTADVFRVKAMLKRADVAQLDVVIDERSDSDAEIGQDATVIASVRSADPGLTADDVRGGVTIDWGDGSVPAAFTDVTANEDGSFTVARAHAYAAPGTYTVTVTASGATADATATHTVTVRDAVQTAVDPAAPDGENGWYTTAPTVRVELTGAAGPTVQYRLGDGDWQTYQAPFPLSDGVHQVTARSLGASGRAGAEVTTTVQVDTLAPQTAASAELGVTDAMVTITASDEVSGVARVEYRFADDDAWTTYSEAFVAPRTASERTLQYRALDIAGNASATLSLVIEALPGAPTGDFDVTKVVVDEAGLVPADAEFVVDYFVNGSAAPSGSLVVAAGETVSGPQGLAEGTTVTFAEQAPAAVPTGTWQTATIDPAQITIAADETATVTVTNELVQNLGTLAIEKLVTGVEADGQEFTFTVTPVGAEPQTVTVTAGESWISAALPQGTVVAISETGSPDLDGLAFTGVTYAGKALTLSEDGRTASVTIGNATTSIVTATNAYSDASSPGAGGEDPGTDDGRPGGLPVTGVQAAVILLALVLLVAGTTMVVARQRRGQA
ncbi:MAG: OmpL47-type beta-barrel domain-containing protein [Cellulomonadaceae bacterium]